MNRDTINAIDDLSSQLRWIIKDLAEYYGDNIDEYTSLKVRPGYGYNKFYLDWVEGSYDMSLQALINFMLQERNHYKKLLSRDTYTRVTKFNKNYPEKLYNFSKNESEQEIIEEIEGTLVCAVRNFCKEFGFSDKSFLDAGYDAESILPHISPTYLVYNKIIYYSGFYNDLKKYIKNNELTEEEKKKIIEISTENNYSFAIGNLLSSKYPKLSNALFMLSISNCTKKSECSRLIFKLKEIGVNEDLINEAKLFKSKL